MEIFIAIVIMLVVIYKFGSYITDEFTESDKPKRDSYDIWLDIFKREKREIYEFSLFGTRAAIAWSFGDTEITIICISSFRNQIPATQKWDRFKFDVNGKFWCSGTPKGAEKQIKDELKKLNLISFDI